MSELTPCNRCTLNRIKRCAKAEGQRVTLTASDFAGGIDVYVHPKDVKIKELTPQEKEQYKQAWFMALTSYCTC